MRRSVRWNLLLGTLAASLMAILVVGLVTLLLINSNFSRQEEEFLRERGKLLVEPLESALNQGSPTNLQQIASFGLLANQMRIKILDSNGHIIVDSGSFEKLFPTEEHLNKSEFDAAFQFLIDEGGQVRGFGFPVEGSLSPFDPFFPSSQDPLLLEQFPFPSFAEHQPIADISDSVVQLPLHIDDQVAAVAELSEGPAFGKVIRDSVQRALLAGAVVAIIVAGLAAVISARQITRPLNELGRAADEMAEGNLAARAPSSNLKEYDRLANRFNLMAERLSSNIASLQAERSSLRRFITDASHELRTPITALKTFNQLLGRQINNQNEPESTFVRESSLQIDQLDQITSDLLNLSRFEARLSGTDLEDTDITLALERAVQLARPISEAKNQRFLKEFSSKPIIMPHDPAAIEIAVGNLLANAVKYTPEQGLIGIQTRIKDGQALVIVSDNGPGINKSEQDFVFDRFFRGRGQSAEGSGLGLAIAQEIASIHNGQITVHSQVGEGSTFTLSLPLPESTDAV